MLMVNKWIMIYQKWPDEHTKPFKGKILIDFGSRWEIEYTLPNGKKKIRRILKGCCSTAPIRKPTKKK